MRLLKYVCVIMLVVLTSLEAEAQITPSFRLGGQEQNQVDKIKRIGKAAKRTKKKEKKSRKQRRAERDSLANAKAEQEGERLRDVAKEAAKDTLNQRFGEEFQQYSDEFGAGERVFDQVKGLSEDSLTAAQLADTVAHTALDYGEKQLEQEAAKALAEQGEGPDLSPFTEGDTPDPSQLLGAGMSKEEMEKLKAMMEIRQAARKLAKSKDLLEAIPKIEASAAQAMPSIDKVKQRYFKYGTVKGHPEKNVFKQQPFHKRFIWGGNLDVVIGLKNTIDFGPFVGYKINKVWSIFIGGKYRTEINFKKGFYFRRGEDEMLGYQLFTQYVLYKSIFAYAGYENNFAAARVDKNTPSDKKPGKVWVPSAMLGIGKKFSVSAKIGAQCILMYDFLYDRNTALYPRPWQVRVGFYKK
jgi:hypothetical protein